MELNIPSHESDTIIQSIKSINNIKNKLWFVKLEIYLTNEIFTIFWFAVEIFKIIFLLEPIIFFAVVKRIEEKRNEIHSLFQYVGRIDTLLSVSILRQELPYYCSPVITEKSKSLEGIELYHPLVLDCVPNDIYIHGKSILLSGSNMSGKTTFIRTIGVNIVAGLALNTCFARSLKLPLSLLFSSIRITDDLFNDKSYFFEEVLVLKEMILNCNSQRPAIFLLDETFKGTNTVERISASKTVLSYLNCDNIVLASTHDLELTELLNQEFDLYHFSETVKDGEVKFDYNIKNGGLKTRNAIRILEIKGYPQEIIAESYQISMMLDKLKKLS